jgi:predicted dehydrogenase
MRALLHSRQDDIFAAVDVAIAETASAPFREQLAAFVRAIFANFDAHRAFFRIAVESEHLRAHAPSPCSAGSPMRAIWERAERLVRRGLDENLLCPEGSDLYPSVLAGMMRGVLVGCTGTDKPFTDETDRVVAIFLHGAARTETRTNIPPSKPIMTETNMLDRKLRGALVGYGFIAEKGHAPAYRALAEQEGAPLAIVAVADTCAARRDKARADIPGVRIYESLEQLLAKEQGTLDFVDVTTPPSDHAKIAIRALARGLHVVCEKPLATTVEDAMHMVAAARAHERVLFPCHNYKHAPVIKTVRRVIDSGEIGAVRLVTLQTFRNTHAKGVRDWRPDWRRERRWSGGGIAMDHGSHTFYLAFDWFGAYPTSITAKMSTLGAFDTEDNFACSMTFPGGTASAHLTWTAGVRKVIYTVHGDLGAVRVEDDDVEVTLARTQPDGSVAWDVRRQVISSSWMDASHVHWFQSMLRDFAEAVERREHVGPQRSRQRTLRRAHHPRLRVGALWVTRAVTRRRRRGGRDVVGAYESAVVRRRCLTSTALRGLDVACSAAVVAMVATLGVAYGIRTLRLRGQARYDRIDKDGDRRCSAAAR